MAMGRSKLGPFLLHIGGREVDRGAAQGEVEAGIGERGADAVARFFHGGIGQPDDDNDGVAPTRR